MEEEFIYKEKDMNKEKEGTKEEEKDESKHWMKQTMDFSQNKNSIDNGVKEKIICHYGNIGHQYEHNNSRRESGSFILFDAAHSKSKSQCFIKKTLWKEYASDSTKSIPIYISLAKCYNEADEQDTISQALRMKQINNEMMDIIRENISFVFILDGFDEIFDAYNKNNNNNDEKYFYSRLNLGQWNAKTIVTYRSNVLSEEDIKQVLVGPNQKHGLTTTSMIYLWPFSKGQMQDYIDKFVKMRKNNKTNDKSNWTIQQYDDTLKNYTNLHKMIEDPFLLQLIIKHWIRILHIKFGWITDFNKLVFNY
ncbi:hypothetical protein RFI_36176, partial [Reticulomyxa filosa]